MSCNTLLPTSSEISSFTIATTITKSITAATTGIVAIMRWKAIIKVDEVYDC
jgi:hypothetical protein